MKPMEWSADFGLWVNTGSANTGHINTLNSSYSRIIEIINKTAMKVAPTVSTLLHGLKFTLTLISMKLIISVFKSKFYIFFSIFFRDHSAGILRRISVLFPQFKRSFGRSLFCWKFWRIAWNRPDDICCNLCEWKWSECDQKCPQTESEGRRAGNNGPSCSMVRSACSIPGLAAHKIYEQFIIFKNVTLNK